MLVLGAMLGVLATVIGVVVLARFAGLSSRRAAYQAQQAINGIERRAIHDMLAAECAAGQSGIDSEIVDGTVTEIVMRS